ncbi:phage tail assembly chaperone [Veillonella magna]|uniref:Phage XkdN-like protein n=1 Tax=Veillonella magna TaxID=464322 RepID=A0ABS2GJ07_9FIRM|nr:hypothetical protein [Veillonella magna]MBM6824788.1 hypothetical protein [Veillonella magna]MBM6913133.1 hypothetical protein [Veillonella magna]
MAVNVQDLIAKKESIEAKKKQTYDFDTSIGTVTATMPSLSFMAEMSTMDDTSEAEQFLVLSMITEPNLKDKELQQAYECVEPIDIVRKLFLPGEIGELTKAILRTAGFGKGIEAKLHDELKN